MILLTHNALEAGPHYTTSVIANDLRKVSAVKAKKVSTKAKFRLESCVCFQKKKIRFRWSHWRFLRKTVTNTNRNVKIAGWTGCAREFISSKFLCAQIYETYMNKWNIYIYMYHEMEVRAWALHSLGCCGTEVNRDSNFTTIFENFTLFTDVLS